MKLHMQFLALILLLVALQACKAPDSVPGNSPLPLKTHSGMVIKCDIRPATNLNISPDSIRVHGHSVLVSTQQGLFRASLEDQKWSQLACPLDFPTLGKLVYQANSADKILFIADSKLYGSEDDGQTWSLLSDAYNFQNAFLHEDGSLYATATIRFKPPDSVRTIQEVPLQMTEPDGQQYYVRDIVLRSKDSGQTWQDITGNIPAGVMLGGIFQDPDHPDLVALVGNSIRNYVFHASDKCYDWRMDREMDWRDYQPITEKEFFDRSYSAGTSLFMFPATLANYFEYDFGSSVALPAFDIVLNQRAYEFGATDSKTIVATIIFRDREYAPQLIDLKDGADLWGMRITSPTNQRTYLLPATRSRPVSNAQDLEQTIQAYRARPDFQRFLVSNGRPYTRLINLDSLFEFSAPGTYKVQLIYDNSFLANWDKREWIGSFTSDVFMVTIREP